jgi:protein-disulfide isomerase
MRTLHFTRLALTAVAAFGIAACNSGGSAPTGDAVAKVAAPAGQKWSDVARATQDGVIIGNPDAPLKLIEFASPTCSHCAEFSKEGSAALKSEFVDSGRVSLEIRPFMLNAIDLVVASIVNCAGPERFVPLLDNVYATQADMFAGVQSADQTAANAAMQLPETQRFPALARALKLDTYFAARGMAAADIDRCLADPAAVNRWQESTTRNQAAFEITGTPTFILNDQVMTGVGTWDGVRDGLRAAGAR